MGSRLGLRSLGWVPVAARELSGGQVKVGTVAGFPLGALPLEIKVAEILWALEHGTQEVDVVLHLGKLLDGKKDEVLSEMIALREAARGICLKVIVETPFLNDEQKVTSRDCLPGQGGLPQNLHGLCRLGVALRRSLLKSAAGEETKVKASGGIRTEAQALAMMAVGADRIGTSNTLAILGSAASRTETPTPLSEKETPPKLPAEPSKRRAEIQAPADTC
jgi:deoxyribose-phosphate aldolase